MALPIRTTLDDIVQLCKYLATKPSGATIAEAAAVLGKKHLDGRKLSALRYWKLIEDEGESEGRLRLTEMGRELAKGDSWRESALLSVVRNVAPYRSIIERAHHRKEDSLTATDVAAYWFDHFRDDVADADAVIKLQAVCFFHVAEGAGLGKIIAGRKGAETRLALYEVPVAAFAEITPSTVVQAVIPRLWRPPTSATATAETLEVGPSSDSEEERGGQRRIEHFLRRGLRVDCYKLDKRLGSGFSAEVWSATVQRVPDGVELNKGQQVAMKFYSANALAIPDQVIRIEREYRVAQRLQHPNLIRIYEFVLASPRPNHNFLVMDIAPGPTLASVLGQRKFTTTESLSVLAQVLSGVEALHEAGALHRDIKPGNIAISLENGPECVLLDLGIVSPMFEKGLTAISRFVGSKHWAPLEQLIGKSLDVRSDLYSVGAVAFNLLVGVVPFSSSNTEAAVAVEMSSSGLRIPDLAGLPSEIVEMFNACLSNSQDERPRSALECLSVLKRHGVEPTRPSGSA